ncbi:MAG: hypothetical protein IEMM0002_0239 [bacterium]|nr:MAG: hypothetical protein IEMM0002_0239 [bacterium]
MVGSARKAKRIWIFAVLAFVLLFPVEAFTTSVLSSNETVIHTAVSSSMRNKLFPQPSALKPNVEFWLKIYTKYHDREAVIHDSDNLGIQYELVNLQTVLGGGGKLSKRSMDRYLNEKKKYYRAILRRLSKQKGKCYNPEECRVGALFAHIQDGRVYARAAKTVRAQYGLSNRFLGGIETSGRYLNEMRIIFASKGLPMELLALPHVESSFNVKAYSRSGAAGIWQFTRLTGKRFMKINYAVDERRDPLLATVAAAKLLKKNYDDLGSWPLAITAYNYGRRGMMRAQKLYGNDMVKIIDNYKNRRFGFASKNFYAEFLAAMEIMKNPAKYFGPVDMKPPLLYDTVAVRDFITSELLATHFGFHMKTLRELNPALRPSVWNGNRRIPKGYNLNLPEGSTVKFAKLYEEIPKKLRHKKQARPKSYFVRRGDSLYTIARKFRTSITSLEQVNDIGNRHRIYVGQKLQIPGRYFKKPAVRTAALEKSGIKKILPVALNKKTVPIKKQVAPPPTVVKAEMKYENPVNFIEEAWMPPVQKYPVALMDRRLPIDAPPVSKYRIVYTGENYGVIQVQPEETIGHYADWASVSAGKIRNLNGWSRRRLIRTGQNIKIPLTRVTEQVFENNRYEYHLGIYEDFFMAYRVEKVDTHVVRKGQSLWTLFNKDYNVPLWLVHLYNMEAQLDNLQPGQKILVPVLEKKES